MFRLIASSQHSLRPTLVQAVRGNQGLLRSSRSQLLAPLRRTRSGSENTRRGRRVASPEHFLALGTISDGGFKITHFRELMNSLENYRKWTSLESGVSAYDQGMTSLLTAFQDKEVRSLLSQKDLARFLHLLSVLMYNNRTSRLKETRNRDSDLYLQNSGLSQDVMLKAETLLIVESIAQGEFNDILLLLALGHLFRSMALNQMQIEMLQFWEDGVNDEINGKHFLDHNILATVLPTAYEQKRFSYEEILHLYEVNTKGTQHAILLLVIGRIALEAGDISRGFECMESLLRMYENAANDNDRRSLLRNLGLLHLLFIGKCKDLEVARQFFDKVILRDLPYVVMLKCNQVSDLFQTCLRTGLPYEDVLYFWSETVKYYSYEDQMRPSFNLWYLVLNSAFFRIFFIKHRVLTADAYTKLRETITLYAQIKPIDEFFLNALINNYTWGDKVVLEQLIASYDIYHVPRTPVSYRVTIKKMGEVASYTEADILAQWNESLRLLDSEGYTYIPLADWAAFRDATILSNNSSARCNLYMAVAFAYRDYIQDQLSVGRFVRHWFKQTAHTRVLDQLTQIEPTVTPVEVPKFKSLTKNVDFIAEAKGMVLRNTQLREEEAALLKAQAEEDAIKEKDSEYEDPEALILESFKDFPNDVSKNVEDNNLGASENSHDHPPSSS